MGIRQNIVELRSIFGITQEQLAKIAGVSRGAVSQWEGGFSEPRMGAIQKIADHFGISKSNIIEDGGMDQIDPVTRKRRISAPANAVFPAQPRPAYAPLLGRVHAGDAQEPDIIDSRIPIPFEVLERHSRGYFLQVEGQCMNRVYPDGCFIFIDPDRQPKNGSVAVVSIDGSDYVMRRLYSTGQTVVLSPDSWEDGYEDIVLTAGDDRTVEYVGTVVWFQPSDELE